MLASAGSRTERWRRKEAGAHSESSQTVSKKIVGYGDVFTGKLVSGYPEHGLLEYANGLRYEGQFVLGIRHGTGRMRYQNGDVYEGNWFRGLICGQGVFKCSVDDTVFSGKFGLRIASQPPLLNIESIGPRLHSEKGAALEWPSLECNPPDGLVPLEGLDASFHPPPHPVFTRHSFLLCGTGSITWRDGRIFRGSFHGGNPVLEEGLPMSKEHWVLELPLFWRRLADGEDYTDEERVRRSNVVHARTAAGRPTVDAYTGEMTMDGIPHGVGCCKYSSGATYEGTWEMGLRHGDGIDIGWPGREDETCTDPPSKWIGPLVRGERTGFGHLTLSDGRTYVGECVAGRIEGQGRLMLPDRVSFHVGLFRDGLPHGRGTVESPGNVRFECNWVNGKREGRGVTISPMGERCEALYENDKMVGGGLFVFKLPTAPIVSQRATKRCQTDLAEISISARSLKMLDSALGPTPVVLAAEEAEGRATCTEGAPSVQADDAKPRVIDEEPPAETVKHVREGGMAPEFEGESSVEDPRELAAMYAKQTASRVIALPRAEHIIAEARKILEHRQMTKGSCEVHNPGPQTFDGRVSGRTPSGSGVAAALALSPTRTCVPASFGGVPQSLSTMQRRRSYTVVPQAGFARIGGTILSTITVSERPVRLELHVVPQVVRAALTVKSGGCIQLWLSGLGHQDSSTGSAGATPVELVPSITCHARLTVAPLHEWHQAVPRSPNPPTTHNYGPQYSRVA